MAYATPTNITGFGGLLNYVNDVTSGMFGIGLSIAIWTILFVNFKTRYETKVSLAVANYISTILIILLWIMGAVTGVVLSFFVVATILSTIALYWKEE